MIRSILTLGFLTLTLSGCNTVPSKPEPAQVNASQWLAVSDMPKADDVPLTAADIASFLRRTGFEPSPTEIAQHLGMTRHQLIQQTLAGLNTRPVVPVPDWVDQDPRYWLADVVDEQTAQAFRNARNAEVGQLRQWWLQQMIETPSPMAERLVMYFDNVFVAGYSGLNEKSHALWQHHQLIRQHAASDYAALVQGIVRDPAVLIYLDNDRNTKEAPNENLAREIMELYVLGEGNYTERDIKQAALALTGYSYTELGGIGFERQAWKMAGGSKTIFDQRGNFDGDDLPRILLDQPAAAEHVARGLWTEFVSTQAPEPEAIEYFAEAFRASGYQVDQLLKVMLHSAYFWDPKHQGFGVKSPVEFVVGTVRSTQSNSLPLVQLVGAIAAQGQTLFDPPDVSGYDGGLDWMAPEYLVERQAFVDDFLAAWQAPPMPAGPDTRLKLTLAGEAYQGPPEYQVVIQHGDGFWYGDTTALTYARDTERLGRYQDDSEYDWGQIAIEVPEQIQDVKSIKVRFVRDAAGGNGDRNLFVGGIEWEGQAIPAGVGVQSPGCSGNSEGTKRRPGHLYCSGSWNVDLATFGQAMTDASQGQPPVPGALNTRGLHVRWASAEDDRWRDMDLVLDGLEFEGREWEVFSFKLGIDDRGEYRISIKGNRCVPDCFDRWPAKAWRDKAGIPTVSVPYNGSQSWSYDHYQGLSKANRRLVKALMSTASQISLDSRTFERNPDRKAFWAEQRDKFAQYADQRRWRLSEQPLLNLIASQESMMMSMMGMQMAGQALDYQPPTGTLTAQALDQQAMALGPLADWALPVNAQVADFGELIRHQGRYLR